MESIPLSDGASSYSSMSKIGTVEITRRENGDLMIITAGFEFSDKPTCRENCVRAMAWAKDLLEAQIRVERLANTTVFSAVG